MGDDSNDMTPSVLSSMRSMRSVRTHHFADGRFILTHRIGGGAFGDLYQAIDARSNRKVAVKLEKRKVAFPQLQYESKVYRLLHQGGHGTVGIPRIYYYDTEGDFNVLVMDLCGPSLEDLFNYCNRKFSVKTMCMLGDQMIQRIELIHEKGFIHRDIKPENFVFGIADKGHILHIIDFGLSKLYWDKRREAHIPFCEGKPLTGTARYCSVGTHRGYEQSRRDDLEAIGFVLVYFLNGSLPWQGMPVKDQQLKTQQIGEKKMNTTLEEICRGCPVELLQYCTYARQLKFTDKPDYDHLRALFKSVARRFHALHRSSNEVIRLLPLIENTPNSSVTSPPDATTESRYDWMFDWLEKRLDEVREGMQSQKHHHKYHPHSSLLSCEVTMLGASTVNSTPDYSNLCSTRVVHTSQV